MTLDLEKMARDSSLRAAVSIRRHIYWNMDDEKQNTVAKLIEFEVLAFARSVQKATQSSAINGSLSGQTIKFTRHPKYPLDGCDPAKCSDINHYFYEVVAEEEG